MCIKIQRRYICPKTETGALGPDPDEEGSPKRRFVGEKPARYGSNIVMEPYTLTCYVDFSNSASGPNEACEAHVCEMVVECGEPQFSCKDLNTMELRRENIPNHHCPICLRIPDYPRAPERTWSYKRPIPEITNDFERGQAMVAFDQYLEGVLNLVLVSLTVLFNQNQDWQIYVQMPSPDRIAGLIYSHFCREDDGHYGVDSWRCTCHSNQAQFAEASNLGRMLRFIDVGVIAESHMDVVLRCVMRDDEGHELDSERDKAWSETINDRWRRLCLAPEERVKHWAHPDEDNRFAQCVAQLEHEVNRTLIEGPTAIAHARYGRIESAEPVDDWDHGKYTMFVRGLAQILYPALAWISYDSGLSNEQVALVARVLFTLVDHNRATGRAPIPGFPEGQQPRIPGALDDIWSIMYITFDCPFQSPVPTLVHDLLNRRIRNVQSKIGVFKRRRAAVFAELSLRLDHAWLMLDSRSLTVQQVLAMRDEPGGDAQAQGHEEQKGPSCTVCDEAYDDTQKLCRPTLLCPEMKHHLCARCCLRMVLTANVRVPDVRCVMCRRECNDWILLSDRTERFMDADAEAAEEILRRFQAAAQL
ncbi:hypothetical protein BN1723_012722, partial [Verticillium longisporum]